MSVDLDALAEKVAEIVGHDLGPDDDESHVEEDCVGCDIKRAARAALVELREACARAAEEFVEGRIGGLTAQVIRKLGER